MINKEVEEEEADTFARTRLKGESKSRANVDSQPWETPLLRSSRPMTYLQKAVT